VSLGECCVGTHCDELCMDRDPQNLAPAVWCHLVAAAPISMHAEAVTLAAGADDF
jgi:hypothetical protein